MIKLFLQYADAQNCTDGVTESQITKHLPLVSSLAEADAVVVLAVCHAGFKFNHKLNELVGKKPIVILDFLEYGWSFDFKQENVLGRGAVYPCTMDNHDWGTLDQWVRNANPVLQLKRELLQKDVSPTLQPIDFVAELPRCPVQSRAEFDARPFDVLNIWGYSHPTRARIHGDFFYAMGNKGINVVDSFDTLGANSHYFPARTWVTIMRHHSVRKPMSEVLALQSKCKISLSLYGAGWKCFRSAESPVDSVMAQQENDLAWSYPWDESNSIRLMDKCEIDDLIFATTRGDLYDLYLAGQRNIDRYRQPEYSRQYILPHIEARI